MNVQTMLDAVDATVKTRRGISAEILDAVEAVLDERVRRIRQTAARMAGLFAQYLEEEFGPWQNANQ